MINLILFPALCAGVGVWSVSRLPAWRVPLGILAAILIGVVNYFIALAGCSATGLLDLQNMH